MLPVKKALHFGLLLLVFASTALVNQAIAGLEITIPVSANNTLISDAVTEVEQSAELDLMRTNVSVATIRAQSALDYDADGNPILFTLNADGEQESVLPMQDQLQPLMQQVLMGTIMESLSNPDNTTGLVPLFAPTFRTFPLPPE